jgi:DNA mismatch repair protein MutL
MSGVVKVLDVNLVNLIAAGEIVERPASVVKELIENSLDAGASSISVEIVRGGKRRIVVIDDGIGMSRDDAMRSLERHATSKISAREDLMAIHTLGFRGEALPSIASVSRFNLFTKEKDARKATDILIEGGRQKHIRGAGVPPGTRIVVEDLFFSIPARRKFLKTDKTEYYHVLDVVNRNALSRPDVRFTFISDGREVLNTHPGNLRERSGDILGRKISDKMEEITYEGAGRWEGMGIGLVGLVGNPEDTRASQSNIYLYVNDRFVKDRVMLSAIMQAYRGLTFRGKYPIVVLFLQIPFSEVDVNIHPEKTEVKFRDSGRIHKIVSRAVGDALAKGGAVKMIGVTGKGASYTYPDSDSDSDLKSDFPKRDTYPKDSQSIQPNSTATTFRRGADLDKSSNVHEVAKIYYDEVRASREEIHQKLGFVELVSPPPFTTAPSSGELFKKWEGLTLLGQVKDTYIVFENEEGLLIIDQHAAHERVVYEWLKAGLKERNITMQQLLFPIKMELSTKDYEVVISNIDKINDLGLEISDFGKGTVVVSSVPGMFKDSDVERLIVEIAEELREHPKATTVESIREKLLLVMSCHGAIRAGKKLEPKEIKALLDEMERTPHSNRCPHGRPTVITVPIMELERRFKRQV